MNTYELKLATERGGAAGLKFDATSEAALLRLTLGAHSAACRLADLDVDALSGILDFTEALHRRVEEIRGAKVLDRADRVRGQVVAEVTAGPPERRSTLPEDYMGNDDGPWTVSTTGDPDGPWKGTMT